MNKKLPIIFVVLGLAIVLPTFFMSSEPTPLKIPPELQGVFVDSPATVLPAFTLTDHNGEKFDNSRFKGKWSLVFFGFTNCPDVCPTSMTVLDKVSQRDEIPADTQYVFISVDPKRDTPDKLKDFVGFFNEKFIGVSGEKAEIDKFKDPLGVIYDFEGDTSTEDYNVTHFAAIYIIDPQGRERAYVLPPHSVDQVAKAYQLVYEYYK